MIHKGPFIGPFSFAPFIRAVDLCASGTGPINVSRIDQEGRDMKGLLRMGILSALLSVFSGPALSDTAKGIAAYQKGNYPLAMQELEKAAASGDEQAYFNLGVAYAEGKAVAQDFGRAVELYRRGAEGGSVLAAFNLAQSYRKGQGTEQDNAAAAKWYEFAAKREIFVPPTSSACFMSKAKVSSAI